MANLKNINFMSETRFDSITPSDDELYLVDYGDIDFVVESHNDGTNWYRKYKSGWIVQGGRVLKGTEGEATIPLLKPMKDTNYSAKVNLFGNTNGYSNPISGTFFTVWGLTTTSFKTKRYSQDTVQQMWEVKGYMA